MSMFPRRFTISPNADAIPARMPKDTLAYDLVHNYNPRHVPAIRSTLTYVREPHVSGFCHHRSIQWQGGYYTEVIAVFNVRCNDPQCQHCRSRT